MVVKGLTKVIRPITFSGRTSQPGASYYEVKKKVEKGLQILERKLRRRLQYLFYCSLFRRRWGHVTLSMGIHFTLCVFFADSFTEWQNNKKRTNSRSCRLGGRTELVGFDAISIYRRASRLDYCRFNIAAYTEKYLIASLTRLAFDAIVSEPAGLVRTIIDFIWAAAGRAGKTVFATALQ